MKKLMMTTLALLSASVFAAPKADVKPQKQAKQPTVVLNVVDVSGKAPKLIKGTKISRSQKQQLCWHSTNVPLTGRVRVAEAFYAPAPTNFASQGMSVRASEDKKEFLIVGDIIPDNKEHLSRCWRFDNKDPIGKYKLDVQIGDIVFKGLSFEITK